MSGKQQQSNNVVILCLEDAALVIGYDHGQEKITIEAMHHKPTNYIEHWTWIERD